ncbi:sensor histidine kinase [Gordoniibacillus kamchatkensis]|uniref:sensor histidine kinase n=1 Tax=Gordoniibacillus kamchatkensis TaxID=1590651 RepID=UPI0006965768|nr:histidine kinase [Paenibacillus sp. VKM B-2647]
MKPTFNPQLYVYQKIIIVFTALLLPVYFINLWMNYMGTSLVKNEYSKSIVSNVQFYSQQLGDQISFIRKQQLQLMNDSDLQKLGFLGRTLEGFEEVRLVDSIRERLVSIQNSTDYIVNTGVYVKSFERTISTRSGVSALTGDEWRTVEAFTRSKPKPSVFADGGSLFFVESSNNSSIVSYVELSKEKLQDSIKRLIDYYKDAGAALADDEFAFPVAPTPGFHTDLGQSMRAMASCANGIEPGGILSLQSGNKSYWGSCSRIGALGLTLYTYVNQNEVTGPLKQFSVWFVLLSIVSIGIVVVFSLSIHHIIHKPVKKLIEAFRKVETDHLQSAVRPQELSEFHYLYRSFDKMMEKLNLQIEQNYEQKIALQHAELKQLQSQINPHFLYNSFYNIYRLCKSGDFGTVAALAQKLGSYYQFITRSGADEVPLAKEYRHAMDYAEIQGIRFSNRITVEEEGVPAAAAQLPVPRLIVQPVIENAFEHALENSVAGGFIRVSVTYADGKLCISVEDSGESLTDEALSQLQEKLAASSAQQEKTGILNVCRRLRLNYGEESGVFVSRSRYGGLKADIVICHGRGGGDSDV